jgi:signal transduction histidine kinase
VSGVRGWAARAGKLVRNPLQVDRVVAAAGFAAAWWDAAGEPHRDLGVLAVLALAVLMGTIAWRRVNPVAATIVAAAALAAFQAVSLYNGDGTFEAAAIAFSFYILGQRTRSRPRILWCAACFAVWLGTAWVITFDPGPGSIGSMAGAWALFGPLPFVGGFLLASRSLLTADLQNRFALLDTEQEHRARSAAGGERNRMARELHDVIAHCLSVMVVQAAGARTVAATDPQRASNALQAVESAGREALADLRRLVGTLRRGDEAGDAHRAGIGDVGVLAERARIAGLEVDVHVSGPVASLDPAVTAVAYRVVQEALTNCIKHAGPARADVSARVHGDSLQIAVTDTGRGEPECASAVPGSGRGLIGMQERIAALGGELRAGPRTEGGFEVCARIPLRGAQPEGSAAAADLTLPSSVGKESRRQWLDLAFAGALLAVLETAVITSSDVRGPLALNALAVSGFAMAALWRRRYPLVFVVVVIVIAGIMSVALTPVRDLAIASACYLLVLPYTVAAWANRFVAVLGLGLVLGFAVTDHLASHTRTPADLAGAAVIAGAAWGLGRAVRAGRAKNATLGSVLSRLAVESDDRTRLAVAGERSRLARELHESLAGSVSVMVVQAEVARALLTDDLSSAERAMTAVEQTGRQALADMRRILGALRRGETTADRQPLPGIDQVYALIKQARDNGQRIELRVEGEPGDIPATVELGVYRVLEEALRDTRSRGDATMSLRLVFGDTDLQLHLTAQVSGVSRWPTSTMRERIALCGGQIDEAGPSKDEWQLALRMPRAAEGALM